MRFAQNDKVDKRDNNKVGVFAFAKDFSAAATPTLEMTRRSSVGIYVKKPLRQPFGLLASP
jgi:hypothetical protein